MRLGNVADEIVSTGAQVATFNSPQINVGGFSKVIAFLEVSAVAGTSPTLDVKLQDSADGVNWHDVASAAFSQKTAAAHDRIETGLLGKYLRSVNAIGGTAAAAATGVLTSDNTNVANNETVTIGAKVYTFKTVLTGAANEVFIGASADASLTNLAAAINGSAGAGTTYGTGTVANVDVTSSAVAAHALTLTAKATGTAANSKATTETSAHLSFGAATLTGGIDTHSFTYDLIVVGIR